MTPLTTMDFILNLCLAGLAVAVLLGLWRVAVGPSVIDRMIGFDLVAVSGVGLVAVVSVVTRTTAFVDLIVVYSLVGFLGTVALTRLLLRTQERGGGGKEGRL